MSKAPSFKIAVFIVSAYVLLLFIPTIDIAATYHINLYFFSLPTSIAGLIFPAIYPLADSVTEVYGKKSTYQMVIMCYVLAVVFSLLNNLMLAESQAHLLYSFMIKSSVILTIIGPIGYFVTAILNIMILSKLKIKMRGRHFVIRSLVSSGLSEIVISFIIYPALFYSHGFEYVLKIALGTSLVKIILTIPFVFVAKFLVVLYRYIDKIDIPLYNQSLAKLPDNVNS